MNNKFFVAGIVASVCIFLYEFLIHGVLLMSTYESTPDVWRPFEQMESLWWFSLLVQIATAFAMAFYMSKKDIRGCKDGACFGRMIGVFAAIMQLGTYAFLPLTMTLPLIWAVVVWIKLIVVGAVIGHLYRR